MDGAGIASIESTHSTACMKTIQSDCNIGTFRSSHLREDRIEFSFANIGDGISSADRSTKPALDAKDVK